MAEHTNSEEPSSPPVVVGRKILDSPSDIKNKKDYERILKVTTRKRSLDSPVKEEKPEEAKSEEASPKKKQKITHESASQSEAVEKTYHCHHVYCDWSGTNKAQLTSHEADESYHKQHLQRSQLFCELCQDLVYNEKWTDVHHQKISNAAKKRKSEMLALIERLKVLQRKKNEFLKAEEEFIYRSDENYRADLVAQPGMYKFDSTPTTIELKDSVQEFEMLPEQWRRQNLFGHIPSLEFDDSLPVNAKHVIEKFKELEYSVENLRSIYRGMTDRYKQIQNDEVYKQWLLFNMCELKLFMDKKGLKTKQKKPKKNSSTPAIQTPNPAVVNLTPVPQAPMMPTNFQMPTMAPAMHMDPQVVMQMAMTVLSYCATIQQANPAQFAMPTLPAMPAYNPNMMGNMGAMNWPQWMAQQPQQLQMPSSQSTPAPSRSSKKKNKKKKHKK